MTHETSGSMFSGLSQGQRVGLATGVLLIAALVGGVAWWANRAPAAVLFSGLTEPDAAVIAAELDKLKQPYTLAEGGHTILVDEASVLRTRMSLMAQPLPLNGAVGFELFNNAEFGASDFVQKVNYQRALQGELTRTIASLAQVQSARVHLTLPEAGLFRREAQRGKASVALVTRPGMVMQAAEVAGIQRLVGASVPEVRPEDVTVLNQHGVVLSRQGGEDQAQATAHLDAKQAMEHNLQQKASLLLDQMFKPGNSMVTVDVVLNRQTSKVTTEEVLAVAPGKDQPHKGVLVRERSTTREKPGSDPTSVEASTVTQELDYQTGKRVSQVNSQSGDVSRINVALVVKVPLTEEESQRVTRLVATSVGLSAARGDSIAIYTMNSGALTPPGAASASLQAEVPPLASKPLAGTSGHPATTEGGAFRVVWALLALLLTAVVGVFLLRARKPASANVKPAAAPLSEAQREAALQKMRAWLTAQPGGVEATKQ